MKQIVTLLIFLLFITTFSFSYEEGQTDSSKIAFENAFNELKEMLEEIIPPDFEKAVFLSENPYHGNKYSYDNFQKGIDFHFYCIKKLIEANDKSDSIDFNVKVNTNGKFKLDEIRYLPKEKKELYRQALTNWAIFTYLTDTTAIYPFYHLPFSYSFQDPFGMKEWSNSQVIHLLASKEQKGNCFALTALFKIFSDCLNSEARICTAPQHIYIQHRDPKGDYYNVELATAGHPGDGLIQVFTYTTTDAIKSGIALRSYDEKQSIGLCLINLAKSYEHKFQTKGDQFILRCADIVLKDDSLNLNALLLKQQVLDARVTDYAIKNKIREIKRLKQDSKISSTLSDLEKHLALLYRLGYRQMPLDMQEMVLKGFQNDNNGTIITDKNPSPFTTVKPKDPNDARYWTLSGGIFQEVFEVKELEQYGHFIFKTETNMISAMDTTSQAGFLIDPVAFAYDFGARMYDARTGIFISTDPLEKKYVGWSPYAAFANNPIRYIDIGGMGPGDRVQAAKNQTGIPYANEGTSILRTGSAEEALKYMDCSEFVCRVLNADDITAKVEWMGSQALYSYLSNSEKFENSTNKPKTGDIAVWGQYVDVKDKDGKPVIDKNTGKVKQVWKGHVGIVSAGNDAGKFKLIHARGKDKLSKENPTLESPEVYRSDIKFLGFFRPKEETPEGKITSESGVGNIQVKNESGDNAVISPEKK